MQKKMVQMFRELSSNDIFDYFYSLSTRNILSPSEGPAFGPERTGGDSKVERDAFSIIFD